MHLNVFYLNMIDLIISKQYVIDVITINDNMVKTWLGGSCLTF
jgi:hypothetical protein